LHAAQVPPVKHKRISSRQGVLETRPLTTSPCALCIAESRQIGQSPQTLLHHENSDLSRLLHGARVVLNDWLTSEVNDAHRRFGKKVPSALVELVEECWAPAMEDRPDFKDITKRFEIIWGAPLFPTP